MAAARLLIHAIKDVTVATFVDTHIRDQAQVEEIGRQLFDLVDNRGHKRIVVDFGKVQILSSQALGTLLTLARKIGDARGSLALCGLKPDLLRLFEIARLNKLFKIHKDEEAALASLGVTTAG